MADPRGPMGNASCEKELALKKTELEFLHRRYEDEKKERERKEAVEKQERKG